MGRGHRTWVDKVGYHYFFRSIRADFREYR